MSYKIEKNIPVQQYRTSEIQNVVSQMEIGDSVLTENQNKSCNFVTAGRRLGVKLVSRSQPDGGVRVWRVA